jgi:cob(I)alamin adenosyltransferase
VATGGQNPTRLYTRTGDDGETALAGGARVAKDSLRINAFGTLDELGAALGLVEAQLPGGAEAVRSLLLRLQHELFVAQAELAVGPGAPPLAHPIQGRHVLGLEAELDRYSDGLEPRRTFVLPRGGRGGAGLHFARTVARRAEREVWTLHRIEAQRPELLQWLNRLSDLLFALALYVNQLEGIQEISPDYTI